MSVECREIIDSIKTAEPMEKTQVCQECEELSKEFAKNPGGKPIRRKGLIVAAVIGGSAIALSAICLPFVTPALRKVCLPYVPATTSQLENIQNALKSFSTGTKLIDIGSGDGRIVHLAAKNGFKAHGIELNPWLVMYSKYKSMRLGVGSSATFARQDLWKTHFGPFDNVVIFGVEQMMPDLETKLSSEVKENCTVIACRFPFPTWQEVATIGTGIDSVWIYKPLMIQQVEKAKNKKETLSSSRQ